MTDESARWDKMTNEELCIEFQQTRSDNLFEYFYKRNVGLVKVCFGNRIAQFSSEADNLKQHSRIAMFYSMLRFDSNIGAKFSTLFKYYAQSEKQKHFGEVSPSTIPKYLYGNYEKALNLQEKHPDYWLFNYQSLDCEVFPSSRETLKDYIADTTTISHIESILENSLNEQYIDLINKVCKPSWAKCIFLYFGLKDNKRYTLDEIGKKFNVSRECIRQKIVKGLKRLRPYLKEILNE